MKLKDMYTLYIKYPKYYYNYIKEQSATKKSATVCLYAYPLLLCNFHWVLPDNVKQII